jgi:hypothetical protein
MEYIYAYRIYYGKMTIEQVPAYKKDATIAVLQNEYGYTVEQQTTT